MPELKRTPKKSKEFTKELKSLKVDRESKIVAKLDDIVVGDFFEKFEIWVF